MLKAVIATAKKNCEIKGLDYGELPAPEGLHWDEVHSVDMIVINVLCQEMISVDVLICTR